MKKLIAYSSVAHMGFVTMGIFAATTQGIAGGIFQMISHGIVSGALFLCVGVVYDRMHTPRDRGLWRAGQPHAGLCRGVHGVHARQCRPAGHLGLRRRIPDAARHLQGQHRGRDAGDARRDPVGRLCALALPQGDLRQAREAERSPASRDHELARDRDLRAAGRPDHPVRRLSEAGPRHVGGLGRRRCSSNYQQALGAAKAAALAQ